MNLKIAIISNLKVFLINPFFLIKKFYYYYFKNLILNNTKDISFNFKNNRLIIPNKIIPILVLEEVFVFKMYNFLSNLNCILDLGAYLGDSTVYLSNSNKKVIAYEADKNNFKYIKLNTKNIKNIKIYNCAVVYSNKKTSTFYNSNDFDYGGNTSNFFDKKNKTIVNNINIKDIITKNKYIDGIKMDIEGGEYEILNYFLKNKNKFKFKKGYIEFHFFGKSENNLKILFNFINFLKSKKYSFDIFDIYNKKLNENLILKKHNNLNDIEELIFHFVFSENEKK